jgi:3-oxoacyl-[acyl-carrier protein] reductase
MTMDPRPDPCTDRATARGTPAAYLVTGSSRGIGLATATALLKTGATVGIHGRDPARLAATCLELAHVGGRAIPLDADLSNPDNAPTLVKRFLDVTGRLDGLVNNAGQGKAVAFRGMTLSRWRETQATNLESTFLAAQVAYGIMRQQGGGAIVNVASMAAHGPGKWMGADYAASKAGVVSLTQSLAFEAARFNIRVNAVSPGMIETDMTAPIAEASRMTLPIPLGRFGRPGEVADVILFLLSDNASYITGQVIHINGGLMT